MAFSQTAPHFTNHQTGFNFRVFFLVLFFAKNVSNGGNGNSIYHFFFITVINFGCLFCFYFSLKMGCGFVEVYKMWVKVAHIL